MAYSGPPICDEMFDEIAEVFSQRGYRIECSADGPMEVRDGDDRQAAST